MASPQSSGFPFATLAIVAAFISSTVLAPRAFDLLRPPDSALPRQLEASTLDIDARLWEDPLATTQRYLVKRDLIDPKANQVDPNKLFQAGAVLLQVLVEREQLTSNDRLVVALLSGASFVGAEETRRRMRYAIGAGLGAEGFWPAKPEHLNLAVATVAGNAELKQTIPVPYEVFKRDAGPVAAGTADVPRAEQRLALLWIDGTALPSPRLDYFAQVLDWLTNDCGERCPHLSIIGPTTSDALRSALQDLDQWAHPRPAAGEVPGARRGYAALARVTVFNASATAPPSSLLPDGARDQALDDFIRSRLQLILGDRQAATDFRFRPAVISDDLVADALMRELRRRGVGDTAEERVVLVAEGDSFYSRELVYRVKCAAIAPHAGAYPMRVEVQTYLRGLDGVVTGEAVKEASARDPRDAKAIEWPEARDQRDYVRRMVDRLRQTEQRPARERDGPPEGNGEEAAAPRNGCEAESRVRAQSGPITAIGVLGFDVHDKLILLQALRAAFPDKPIFTTDLDARYLHPRTWPFTRNLIAGGGLSLRTPLPVDGSDAVMPMRDSYQMSAYFAARWAAGDAEKTRCKVAPRLAAPRLWEVGRSDFVRLSAPAADLTNLKAAAPLAFRDCDEELIPLRAPSPRINLLLGLALALPILLVTIVLARTALSPAMHAMRRKSNTGDPECLACPEQRRIVTFFLGAYSAVLAFATASLLEVAAPGRLSASHVLALTALGPVIAWTAIFPRVDRFRRVLSGRFGGRSSSDILGLAALVILGALALAAFMVGWNQRPEPVFEPLRWAEGVSAWPSHLLHLVAILVALVYADRTWFSALDSTAKVETELGMHEVPWAARAAPGKQAPWQRAWHWLRARLIISWHSNGSDGNVFRSLWHEYRERGRGSARLLRVTLWSLVTVLLALLFAQLIDIGFRMDVPARGEVHRAIIHAGQVVALLALAILSVAVADATMLGCRLIRFMNRARSIYPHEVLATQARALGEQDGKLWQEVVPGEGMRAAQRGGHSLLDDWLDVRVIAERSDGIAKLIIGPFVVLALVIVARSRVFDAWSLNLIVACIGGGFLLWMLLLAALLKVHAEKLRATALERMQSDLRWLAGSGEAYKSLVDPFKRLIATVESNRTGAFAPIFDQPLVRAILVPLGGAGGVQFFDYFLLGA